MAFVQLLQQVTSTLWQHCWRQEQPDQEKQQHLLVLQYGLCWALGYMTRRTQRLCWLLSPTAVRASSRLPLQANNSSRHAP
jgi:hypothetical protein